jgi:hypothetical protein
VVNVRRVCRMIGISLICGSPVYWMVSLWWHPLGGAASVNPVEAFLLCPPMAQIVGVVLMWHAVTGDDSTAIPLLKRIALLGAASAVISLPPLITVTRREGARERSFESTHRGKMDSLAEQALAAEAVTLAALGKLERPYVIFECGRSEYAGEDCDGKLPADAQKLKPTPNWAADVFGEGLLRRIRLGSLETPPDFAVSTVIIASYGKFYSGRVIPNGMTSSGGEEILQYAQLFAVNLRNKTKAVVPGRIVGPDAEARPRQLGGGAVYVVAVTGELPRFGAIKEAADALVR